MNVIKIDTEQTRAKKLSDYLVEIINTLLNTRAKNININMLSKNINSYSLDKVPTASTVETWVTGLEIHKDVYIFRSRNSYSIDVIENLKNIGFFEEFESIIKTNNKEGKLPKIEGIESIECLNCGTLNNIQDNTAIFDIQIQINFRKEN